MIAAFLAAWPTILAIALCAWAVIATAGCIDANEHARRETARADRAEDFAEECLEVQEGLVTTLAAFRVANDRLLVFIKDGMEAEEYAAMFGRAATPEQAAQRIQEGAMLAALDAETWGQG